MGCAGQRRANAGYRVGVHVVPHRSAEVGPALNTIQLLPAAWGDRPFSPSVLRYIAGTLRALGFFTTWFSCNGANDNGWFCDPRIDRRIARAHALQSFRPRAAALLRARIDRELVDRAVWVPIAAERSIDLLSSRVRASSPTSCICRPAVAEFASL